MKSPQEIKFNLDCFTGTENYYRWSVLFPDVVLTDGAKYLAEAADAYWLMDLLASHLPSYKTAGFAVAKLQLDPEKACAPVERLRLVPVPEGGRRPGRRGGECGQARRRREQKMQNRS